MAGPLSAALAPGADDINAFVLDWLNGPAAGDCRCAAFAGRWIERVRGVDPAARWARQARRAASAQRLAQMGGGLVAMADIALRDVGILRTAAPRTGDIAVVELPEVDCRGFDGAFAICTSDDGASFVMPDADQDAVVGFDLDDAVLLAAWRI